MTTLYATMALPMAFADAAKAFAYAVENGRDAIVHAFAEQDYAAAVSRIGALVMGRACPFSTDVGPNGFTIRVLGFERWSVTVRRSWEATTCA